MIDPNKLKVGDRIGHPYYGVGVVEVRDSLRVNGPIGLRVNWDRGGEWLWLLTDARWKEVTDNPCRHGNNANTCSVCEDIRSGYVNTEG